MLTLAQIEEAVGQELGDLSTLVPTGAVERWFNEAQARLQWYQRAVFDVEWTAGDIYVTVSTPAALAGMEEILYPEGNRERRWQFAQGGIQIEDFDGAEYDGEAKVLGFAFWPEVDDSTPSALPRVADTACISFCLYKFFRLMVANRSIYQRYSVMVGENGVSMDDLADQADDHYRDYLETRNELPQGTSSFFYPED